MITLAPHKTASLSATEKSSSGEKKLLVLAVDDEPHIVTLLQMSLDSTFEVKGATSAEEALVVANTFPVNVITLDIMMPGIDGYELCSLLRDHPHTKNAFILMLSAKGDSSDKKKAFAAGADAYLTKPFDPLTLPGHLKTLLKTRKSFTKY